MRRFIIKSLLLTIPAIVFTSIYFYIIPLYKLKGGKYQEEVAGKEIYLSIKKSKEKSSKKTLIIGDSVGCQLFNNNESNDTINSLACNQAIGVIGQYFLLNNYINEGNKPKEVFMLYTPFSFMNNLNQVYTFHYFLKPFYKQEYLGLYTECAINQINKIPYSTFCQMPYNLTSNWAPDFNCKDDVSYTFLSPISIEYIEKIKKICVAKNIDFFIIPTPTRQSKKTKVLELNKNEVYNLMTEREFCYFLNNVNYFPDSLYIDNVHLKEPEKLKHIVLLEMDKARRSKAKES